MLLPKNNQNKSSERKSTKQSKNGKCNPYIGLSIFCISAVGTIAAVVATAVAAVVAVVVAVV